MSDTFHVVPRPVHDALVSAAYRHRGYLPDESAEAAYWCAEAARHGIRTHHALKALHLDHGFGSGTGGCVPGAQIEEIPSRFTATRVWNANRKLGQAVAARAMETAIKLADAHGTGTVSVDGAFHYLWGGGYVMAAARRGYIAYTNCTAALAEVVPHGGRFPTLGTNPHSWAFPTVEAVGFPITIDWATSVIAMGRVQQLRREGKELPPGAAVDAHGRPTTDPAAAVSLLPFGGHKGYGLSLVNEIVSAFIGGSLPTLRSRPQAAAGEKHSCTFFFHVIHPDALSAGAFAAGRTQAGNVRAVLLDILGHGNDGVLLPGEPEARSAARSNAAGGLLFTPAELAGFAELAAECGLPPWDPHAFPLAPAR